MKRTPAYAVATLAVVVLGGCGGGSSAPRADPGASGLVPAGHHSPVDRSLESAAHRLFRLLADGDRKEVYHQLISTRCQHAMTLAEFEKWYRPHNGPVHIVAYSRRDTGFVSWVVSPPSNAAFRSDGTAWPWVREQGHWRSDECPTLTPSSQ